MPAQDTDELFDLRGQLESGLSAAVAVELSKYTRENSVALQLNRPRFEFVVKIGQPLGHRRIFADGVRRYDMFNFSFACTVTTPAAAAPADGEAQENKLHQQMIARAESAFNGLNQATKNVSEAWPVLTVMMLRGGGHSPALKPQEGSEQTTLNYSGHFGIRPEAWPLDLPVKN